MQLRSKLNGLNREVNMIETIIKEICSYEELTQKLTGPSEDYNYQLKWWNIRGYDKWDPNSACRRYAKLERKGYVGITCSSITPSEIKKIRKWVKDHNNESIYLSNIVWYWNADCDGYNDNEFCLWFLKKEQREDFKLFLETFEKRSLNIKLDYGEKIVNSIIKKVRNKKKINYWVVRVRKGGYVFQTDDKETAKQILRFTKELSDPEIIILE